MWLRKGDQVVLVPEHMPETVQRCLGDGWVQTGAPTVPQAVLPAPVPTPEPGPEPQPLAPAFRDTEPFTEADAAEMHEFIERRPAPPSRPQRAKRGRR